MAPSLKVHDTWLRYSCIGTLRPAPPMSILSHACTCIIYMCHTDHPHALTHTSYILTNGYAHTCTLCTQAHVYRMCTTVIVNHCACTYSHTLGAWAYSVAQLQLGS